jgi:hypothetical protein
MSWYEQIANPHKVPLTESIIRAVKDAVDAGHEVRDLLLTPRGEIILNRTKIDADSFERVFNNTPNT